MQTGGTKGTGGVLMPKHGRVSGWCALEAVFKVAEGVDSGVGKGFNQGR